MEKHKALSENDILKLKAEIRNSQRILITVIVSTLLFYIVVLVVSSSLNKLADSWIFTGFCLLFLFDFF